MTFLTCAFSLSRPCDSSQFIVEKGENNKGQFLTSHRTVSNVMFVAAFFGDTAESHVLLCTTPRRRQSCASVGCARRLCCSVLQCRCTIAPEGDTVKVMLHSPWRVAFLLPPDNCLGSNKKP